MLNLQKQNIKISRTDYSLENVFDRLFGKVNKSKFKNRLKFSEKISLKGIFYNYPNSERTAVKNINLDISIGSRIGIVGTTGSGKTTLVDIILGLLKMQKGTLTVDDKILDEYNLRSWQYLIGYVPQSIYLSDDTLSANIAFGMETDKINYDAVEKASKIANLHNFVINDLPKKYNTLIGERGVRLSGGQRQRIGIARALYHNPKVLILDEATSALDNTTERNVMDGINKLGENMTIIIIAHRLSTLKNCDKIYLLENGQIKNEGTYQELIETNEKLKI